MEVAERCEVILAHQDVRVSQVRQVLRLGVQLVLNVLRAIGKAEQHRRVTEETQDVILRQVQYKTMNSYNSKRWWISANMTVTCVRTL